MSSGVLGLALRLADVFAPAIRGQRGRSIAVLRANRDSETSQRGALIMRRRFFKKAPDSGQFRGPLGVINVLGANDAVRGNQRCDHFDSGADNYSLTDSDVPSESVDHIFNATVTSRNSLPLPSPSRAVNHCVRPWCMAVTS